MIMGAGALLRFANKGSCDSVNKPKCSLRMCAKYSSLLVNDMAEWALDVHLQLVVWF
jgi:hypothetical protein